MKEITGTYGDVTVTISQSQSWFPGKDYPDREIWLKIRTTIRHGINAVRKRIARYICRGYWRDDRDIVCIDEADGSKQWRAVKPMQIGINQAKRTADRKHAKLFGSKHPAKHGSRNLIVRQRHAYYRRTAV